MKRLLASLVCVAGLSVAQADALRANLEDILLLTERGVSNETVLVFLESREVGFTPDAGDIDKLLAAGVSEEVIQYILRQTATSSTTSDTYQTISYVDRYPPYYYAPYYSRTSLIIGYSSFPHSWFRHHNGGVHHSAVHHVGQNDHRTLSRAAHREGHTETHAGRHSVGHSSRSTAHRGGHSGGHGSGHSGGH